MPPGFTTPPTKFRHTHTHTHTYTYIHTMYYYSAIKDNEIMPFVATWIDVEIIILSEGRKRKTNIYHLDVESKMMIQMNLSTEQK